MFPPCFCTNSLPACMSHWIQCFMRALARSAAPPRLPIPSECNPEAAKLFTSKDKVDLLRKGGKVRPSQNQHSVSFSPAQYWFSVFVAGFCFVLLLEKSRRSVLCSHHPSLPKVLWEWEFQIKEHLCLFVCLYETKTNRKKMGILILSLRVTQISQAVFTSWGRKQLESNLQVRGNVHLVLLNKNRDQDYFSLLTIANKGKRFIRNKRYRITRNVSPSDVLPHYFFWHVTDHLELNSKPIIVTYGDKFFEPVCSEQKTVGC